MRLANRREPQSAEGLAQSGCGQFCFVAHPLRSVGACSTGRRARSHKRTAAPPQHRTAKRCDTSGGFMTQLVAFVKSVARNEEGQDLLEYALLVALIALVAIAAVGAAGGAVEGIFSTIA